MFDKLVRSGKCSVILQAMDSFSTAQRKTSNTIPVSDFGSTDVHMSGKREAHYSETGGIPWRESICEDAVIMITRRIDAQDQLVNGQRGAVVGWDGDDQKVSIVYVRFKESMVGISRKSSRCRFGPDVVPIEPSVAEYDGWRGRKVVRSGFALVLAWAMSAHKCQGLTVPKLCISMVNAFEDCQIYVACSRTTSSNNIAVLGEFHFQRTRCNPLALEEMRRLRSKPRAEITALRVSLQQQLQKDFGTVINDPFLRASAVDENKGVSCKYCKKHFCTLEEALNHELKAKCRAE
jgi:hypothetical protein